MVVQTAGILHSEQQSLLGQIESVVGSLLSLGNLLFAIGIATATTDIDGVRVNLQPLQDRVNLVVQVINGGIPTIDGISDTIDTILNINLPCIQGVQDLQLILDLAELNLNPLIIVRIGDVDSGVTTTAAFACARLDVLDSFLKVSNSLQSLFKLLLRSVLGRIAGATLNVVEFLFQLSNLILNSISKSDLLVNTSLQIIVRILIVVFTSYETAHAKHCQCKHEESSNNFLVHK